MKKLALFRHIVIICLFSTLLALLLSSTSVYADDPTPEVSPTAAPTPTPLPKCNVTYDTNGHGGTAVTIVVTYGSVAPKPKDPKANRWSFEGWFLDPKFKTAYNFDTPVREDMTLYAKWLLEKDKAASSNTVTPEPEESQTKGLTEALLGNGKANDPYPSIEVPEALSKGRTGVYYFDEDDSKTDSEADEAALTESVSPGPTESEDELNTEDEELIFPSPVEVVATYNEIDIPSTTYRDSIPWVTILGLICIAGLLYLIVRVYQNYKELDDDDY